MRLRRWVGRFAAIVIVVAAVGSAVFWWSRPKPAPAATAMPPPQVGIVEVKAADVPVQTEAQAAKQPVGNVRGEAAPATSGNSEQSRN